MTRVKFTLFGKPTVFYEDTAVNLSVKKAFALLAFLATTGKPQSRERLATLLWQDTSEEVARSSLRQALRALRETPLASVLVTTRDHVELHADFESDAQSFHQSVSAINLEAYATTRMQSPPMTLEVVTQLQAAAALYQGEFMEDFNILGSLEWDDWLQLRRIDFHYQATQIFALLTRYYTERKLVDSGLQMARRWLDLDIYNEEAYRSIMYLSALNNQTERAMDQYHLLVRLLKREQGRNPDPKTQKLYEQIRLGQPFDMESRTSLKSMRGILPKPSPVLPGQELVRNQLNRQLRTADHTGPVPLVVLYDSNGSSGSELIAQTAHDPDIQAVFTDGILWAELENDSELDAILRLWLDALRVSILKSTRKIEHLAWQLHNGMRGKRILLLLENLQDERYGRLLTPGYPQCSLVLSTSKWSCARSLVSNTDHLIMLTPVTPTYRKRAT